MEELQEALAIDPGQPRLLCSNISYAEGIIRSCGSLVNHDKDVGNVKFSHDSVREFLTDHLSEYIFEESDIALSCLTCFSFPFDSDPTELHVKMPPFALEDYVSEFWAEHVRRTESHRSLEVEMTVLYLFGSPENALSTIPRVNSRYGGFNFFHIAIFARIEFILTKGLPYEQITTR
jgi:hypothetical protein